MRLDQTSRLVIIGNCGSGKSTLAARLAARCDLPVHPLDPIHWQSLGMERDASAARVLVAEIAASDAWIVEGVFGWLVEVALPRATGLVWLDLPRDDCRDGLQQRGPMQEGSPTAHDALLRWAGDDWKRTSSSSFAGHASLYDGFRGVRLRLRSREQIREASEQLLRKVRVDAPPSR